MEQAHGMTLQEKFHATSREFRNSDELGENFNCANLKFWQMARGQYRVQWQMGFIGPITFQQTSFTLGTVVEGGTSPAFTNIVLVDAPMGQVNLTGQRLNPGEIMIYGPSAEHFSVASNRSTYSISLPTGMLETELKARLNIEDLDFAKQRHLLRIGTHSHQQLISIFGETYRLLNQETETPTRTALEQLKQAALSRICTTLLRETPNLFPETRTTQTASSILLKARACLEEAGTRPVYIGEICQATGVSARTLQMVFSTAVGISPMRYLKIRRLNLVRSRLMITPRDQLSIKQAAREGGFWDDGHFSSDFFKLFGILPSHTPRP
jgi:AraC-like DNA-binding protein